MGWDENYSISQNYIEHGIEETLRKIKVNKNCEQRKGYIFSVGIDSTLATSLNGSELVTFPLTFMFYYHYLISDPTGKHTASIEIETSDRQD